MKNKEIYLDNAATTRPWPEVVDVVTKLMGEGFGNASSVHKRGVAAERHIDKARKKVLTLIGSGPWDVIFTSGGTEADVTAVLGTVPRGKKNGIVLTTAEHPAVESPAKYLADKGCNIKFISVNSQGIVSADEVADAAKEINAALVTINYVAGELGTVQDVQTIAKKVAAAVPDCLIHLDAVQALAQLPELNIPSEVGMISISSHKIHGPQGVGALLKRPNVSIRSLIFGGDQQNKLRSGTFNLAGIAGFGEAASILLKHRNSGFEKMKNSTDLLIETILEKTDGVRVIGNPKNRAPGMVVLAVKDIKSEILIHQLEEKNLIASAGSACHSTRNKPAACLVEAGLKDYEGAVRLSLTIDTPPAHILPAAQIISDSIKTVRRLVS